MNHKEYVARVRKMNPIDDDFLRKMAEDKAFCQEVIRTILGDMHLHVVELISQDSIKNLQGRSVVLDAHCVTKSGVHFNVEVQKSDGDNHQKRVRYNAACVTANITNPGDKFEKIPTVCVIYITKRDFFKRGKTTYHVDRVLRETGEILDNGFSEIYVNAYVKDGSPTAELMTIFTEDDAYDDEKFPATSRRKRYFKEGARGVNEMCAIVQEIREEGRLELVIQMYNDGAISLAKACEYLNLTEEEFLDKKKKYDK